MLISSLLWSCVETEQLNANNFKLSNVTYMYISYTYLFRPAEFTIYRIIKLTTVPIKLPLANICNCAFQKIFNFIQGTTASDRLGQNTGRKCAFYSWLCCKWGMIGWNLWGIFIFRSPWLRIATLLTFSKGDFSSPLLLWLCFDSSVVGGLYK